MDSCIFPQELVDNIIDHLHDDTQDDTQALRRCSLVCHAWVPSSRTHLFRRLDFTSPSSSHPLGVSSNPFHIVRPSLSERCYRLLTASPQIATYCRELGLYEGRDTGEVPWIYRDRALPLLLPLLVRLRNIEICGVHWDTMSVELISSIHTVFQLPSLVRVNLVDCIVARSVPYFELFGSGVKHLDLQKVQFRDREGVLNKPLQDLNGYQQAQLESLEIHHPRGLTSAIDWILTRRSIAIDDTTNLVRLLYYGDLPSMLSLDNLLRVSPNLIHFEFQPISQTYPNYSFPFPDISCNRALHSLRLSGINARRTLNDLPGLTSFFSEIRSSQRLGVVLIEANIALDEVGDVDWAIVRGGWIDLDRELCRPEFSTLREVHLRFSLPPGASPPPVHPDKETAFRMSGLTSRGILHTNVLDNPTRRFFQAEFLHA